MKHRRLDDIAGLTHPGLRRQNNEDAIAWDLECGLALVADGIGGHNAGEVASLTVARSIKADLLAVCRGAPAADGSDSRESRQALVQELVRRADGRVRTTATRDPKFNGMGTTLALALLGNDFVTVAHVGDSRVYRMRAEELERLTADHQLSDELIRRVAGGSRHATTVVHRNLLSRALGTHSDSTPEIAHHEIQPGDIYLLCTDGLTLGVSDEELAGLLRRHSLDLRDAAQRAVALANRRGGRDNISVVIARLT